LRICAAGIIFIVHCIRLLREDSRMTPSSEGLPSAPRKNNTLVWVIVGVIALCGCGAIVAGIVGLGAASFFGISSRQISVPPQPTAPLPARPAQTAPSQGARITDGEVGVVIVVPDQGNAHVPNGTTVNYNSDPPTSGPHYAEPLPAGFYTDAVLDGHIVHSMEHGYVVIWYDCSTPTSADCKGLQNDIRSLIRNSAATKLIGMPRQGMAHPIALTSWGKLAYLDQFDADFINAFIRDHVGQSPEPGGP
jgi:hypothetical protein